MQPDFFNKADLSWKGTRVHLRLRLHSRPCLHLLLGVKTHLVRHECAPVLHCKP